MSQNKPKIIIIIPAFNEQKSISSVINRIREVNKTYDIAVIDDCSNDKTADIALSMGVSVLRHRINMGYGISLQTGYKYAFKNKYEIIVQLDADGQHDPGYIPEMIEYLRSSNVDMIIGSRYLKKTNYKTPIIRKLGILFFRTLVRIVTDKMIYDPTSGYRVISSRVLPLLISDEFPCDFPDADLIIMLNYSGFSIMELSLEMHQNKEGKSMHNGLVNNLFYIFKMCLSVFLVVISKKIRIKNN